MGIYLATRLIGLTRYPIYFFTDEAIQTQAIADLVANGYQDGTGVLFPAYFRNGLYHNLSLSVYLQWLPYLLFGKSAFVTRAVSALVTCLAAAAIGLTLRQAFRAKYWWAGTLFLSITPAWFLHSRTAFETAEFTAFYGVALYAYLSYRAGTPRHLPLAVFAGALAFYSYSPAQLIVPATALALLASDWRYHWENRGMVLAGLALTGILAMPYLRFRLDYPLAPTEHLYLLGSYLTRPAPVTEKIARYLQEYALGLSPWYWYQPNNRDFVRHLMDGYGNILIATLPLALIGLGRVLRSLRQPASRAVLTAILIAPTSAAMVQTGITRALVFVIPAAILTALGLEELLRWMEHPRACLAVLGRGGGLTPRRAFSAGLVLLAGIGAALFARETLDRLAACALAALLSLPASGVLEPAARRLALRWRRWRLPRRCLALAAFGTLAVVNLGLLAEALIRGPLWNRNYGLDGMQYGAFQLFDAVDRYREANPGTRIVLSPVWANGPKTPARFFLDDPLPFEFGSILGHIQEKHALDDNTLFIMIPWEYEQVVASGKFDRIQVEQVLPYPDGTPGFRFVRLQYAAGADALFAAEAARREALEKSAVMIDGRQVELRHSRLDAVSQTGAIQLIFDGDPLSLAKTAEVNPFVLEMSFPEPRALGGLSIVVGSTYTQIRLTCQAGPGEPAFTYILKGVGTARDPQLVFRLPGTRQVQVLRLEVQDQSSPAPAPVHIWELTLQ
jgi:4-amino-4-deoxy-L-arabinose transferase-like glycosyltransferase